MQASTQHANQSPGADGIDHLTLGHLKLSGIALGVTALFQPGGWTLSVAYGHASSTLVASRTKQPRQFKRLETVVSYLQELGIAGFTVDATGYDAEAVSTYHRPDAKQRLTKALTSPAVKQKAPARKRSGS